MSALASVPSAHMQRPWRHYTKSKQLNFFLFFLYCSGAARARLTCACLGHGSTVGAAVAFHVALVAVWSGANKFAVRAGAANGGAVRAHFGIGLTSNAARNEDRVRV